MKRSIVAHSCFFIWLFLFVLCSIPVTAIAEEVGFCKAAAESLTGDVYANPERWQSLSIYTLFTEGWNEPWVSPPTGEGYAPRQGWINASDGVFYRLGIGTFGYSNGSERLGDRYIGGATLYAPLSRRLEVQFDVPFADSYDGHTDFGDLQITPRIILSETKAVTESFNLSIRIPTGDKDNGNRSGVITPNYQFWSNWWKGLVLRGGLGMAIPFHNQSDTGARTSIVGNFAAGYYFTEHDAAPFGDFVTYVAANYGQAVDDRDDSKTTSLSLTPGFRTHLGNNWYLLGGVEVPTTKPKAYDYQILSGLMLVF